jgi:hypothetical protein
MHLLTIALAEDRAATLGQERRRHGSLPARAPRRPTAAARRALAHGLVIISLVSAAAVRRLDACIADDLVRPMVPTDGA